MSTKLSSSHTKHFVPDFERFHVTSNRFNLASEFLSQNRFPWFRKAEKQPHKMWLTCSSNNACGCRCGRMYFDQDFVAGWNRFFDFLQLKYIRRPVFGAYHCLHAACSVQFHANRRISNSATSSITAKKMSSRSGALLTPITLTIWSTLMTRLARRFALKFRN